MFVGWRLALGHLISAIFLAVNRHPVRLGAFEARRDSALAYRQNDRARRSSTRAGAEAEPDRAGTNVLAWLSDALDPAEFIKGACTGAWRLNRGRDAAGRVHRDQGDLAAFGRVVS